MAASASALVVFSAVDGLRENGDLRQSDIQTKTPPIWRGVTRTPPRPPRLQYRTRLRFLCLSQSPRGLLNCCKIAIALIGRVLSVIADFVIASMARALQHIEPQQPPDKEYCNNCPCDMNDPVASCFRFAEIEHDGSVPRGLKQGLRSDCSTGTLRPR